MTELAIRKSRKELEKVLAEPGQPLIPELMTAAQNSSRVRDLPTTRLLLEESAHLAEDLGNIPQTTYTLYRETQRTGSHHIYAEPYMAKRAKMTAAGLRVLIGDLRYIDPLQDYIWNICEETYWPLPQVEHVFIDLRAVGTGLALAEIIASLGHRLEERIVRRVREEIERRIFGPYLERHEELWWFRGGNNWNGVCNGGIGAMFLLLEEDTSRLARALELVLEGLEVFFATAFEPDGGSTEGPGYWQYGLTNLAYFAEMLKNRTNGAIDILGSERLATIARFPLHVLLSPGRYANFSDSDEETVFLPGLIARLAERTGVEELRGLLGEPAPVRTFTHRFHEVWRNMLWWDGSRPTPPQPYDVLLESAGVARLVAITASGASVVLAAKAGHNGENHNQNDVGTFILHVDGETFLCDPGRGLYSVQYFSPQRYENIFANSFGHSVPRVGGRLQSPGPERRGKVVRFETEGKAKRVVMSLEGAYEVPGLERLQRAMTLAAEDSGVSLYLEDSFTFASDPQPVEEAFVTWRRTLVSGKAALIVGERHILEMVIEAPQEAFWKLVVLSKESEANRKPVPLKRLTFHLPAQGEATARVRMRVLPQ